MSLTLEEIKPTCTYWANRYRSKHFEFNELFNIAYLIGIRQTTVLTLQKSIKGGLLRFIENRQKFTSKCQTFDNASSEPFCYYDETIQNLINSEELLKLIEEANLIQSAEFLEILRLKFVENMTQQEIAEKFNVSQQVISNRYNAILEALKTVNRRRQ